MARAADQSFLQRHRQRIAEREVIDVALEARRRGRIEFPERLSDKKMGGEYERRSKNHV